MQAQSRLRRERTVPCLPSRHHPSTASRRGVVALRARSGRGACVVRAGRRGRTIVPGRDRRGYAERRSRGTSASPSKARLSRR